MSSAIKSAYGAAAAFTITNANLTNSPTAGWKSDAIDNTANLYLDELVSIQLAAVNTAPGNSKTLWIFGYSWDSNAYSGTGAAAIDGSEGTVTFPDITTIGTILPVVGIVPYTVQNIANNSPMFSVAAAFGGILPPKWGLAIINHTGMTLNVTNIYHRPIYRTVG
jgi:hypothetical protein